MCVLTCVCVLVCVCASLCACAISSATFIQHWWKTWENTWEENCSRCANETKFLVLPSPLRPFLVTVGSGFGLISVPDDWMKMPPWRFFFNFFFFWQVWVKRIRRMLKKFNLKEKELFNFFRQWALPSFFVPSLPTPLPTRTSPVVLGKTSVFVELIYFCFLLLLRL